MKQNRRHFLKLGVVSLASATAGHAARGQPNVDPPSATKPSENSIAGYPFDHVRGLIDGQVSIEGFEFEYQTGKIGDLNTHVFSGPQTLDVTEIGLSPFMHAFANDGFRKYSLIPVFPLRLFRHKSIFVHADRGIQQPADLKGRRIGTPGYSSTSLTWIRGLLKDEYGVEPGDIEWVLSAADSSAKDSGKTSRQENIVPDNISIAVGPEGKDESDLLIEGEVDALLHAAEPRAFVQGHPKVKRLFSDPRQAEQSYFSRTGIFPIMHAVAIRRDLIESKPKLPAAVFKAYSQAKQLSYQSMRNQWFLRTLPWFAQELDATQQLMGKNFWPYGVAANRKTLDTLFRYSYEQGLSTRRLHVDEVFESSTLNLVDA